MQTLSEAVQKDQNFCLLLVGPPGTGKTSFGLQWPGLWIADCDRNLAGPARRYTSEQVSDIKVSSIKTDDKGELVAPHKQWTRLKQETYKAIKDDTRKTLMIDSLTLMNEMIIQHTLDEKKKTELSQNDYGPFRRELLGYLEILRSQPKPVIVTAHENIERNREGNVLKFSVVITTRVRDYIGAYFSDVWRCFKVAAPNGKEDFKVRTTSDGYSDLKCTLDLPGMFVPDYKLIASAFEKIKEVK